MHVDGPVRVLRVIARLNVGGPALHVSYLTKGLDAYGYETMLVAGTVGEHEGSMDYVARHLGIRPVRIPELQREIASKADLNAVRHVMRLIRSYRPHVLHTHTAKAGAIGRAAAMLAGASRPPVVVHTFHGHVLAGYFDQPSTAVFRQIERGLARRTDALVAVSPEVRDDLVALGVAPPERIGVIRLGLDLSRRTRTTPAERSDLRRALGLRDDAYVVGWLGRMTSIKRVEDVIAASALARASGVDLQLVLVGDGPLRAQLEHRAVEAGIADACRFTGFQDDVGKFYAAFDTVVLASANEGTPVTLIEALSAGRPVVSTNVGGVPDVVRDGETGLLVPPADTPALANALVRLASDPDLRASMGKQGRETTPQRYSVDRLLADVDVLYRSLLDQKLPAGRPRRLTGAVRPLAPALRGISPVRRLPSERLRILVFSQYFPPEVGATQTRTQAFAEYLSAQGHDVTVICEFPNHPHGVIPPEYRHRLIEDDSSNAYRVIRVWVWTSSEKTQLTRMSFYLSYLAMASAVAPAAGRPDVVFATSPPLFTGVAGAVVAGLWGVPFVLDVRDLWPAAAVSLGQLSNRSARRLAYALERWLYREAEAVVAVTRPFCDHVDEIRGRPPSTTLIPNGTLAQFLEASADGAREMLGMSEDRFLVTFAGNLGIAQGLGAILDAADRSRGEFDFSLVGDGPIKEQLIDQARARGIENIHFHGQVPLDDVPAILTASDALLVTLSGHPTFRDFVPSKLIDYMATGRPVVLSAAGEAAGIVERAKGGITVPPEDADAIVGALRWLKRRPEEAQAMGRAGRAFARTLLREAQAARLEVLLREVAEVKRAEVANRTRPTR
jgi:glycosyltransferase involved in cell wall biosynthesis